MRNRVVLGLTILSVGGIGAYFLFGQDLFTSKVENEYVITQELLADDLKEIDKSNQAKAIAKVYKDMQENQFATKDGNVVIPDVQDDLKNQLSLETHEFPLIGENEVEPYMTELIYESFSRKDGTTNEVNDEFSKVIEGETLDAWKDLFNQWIGNKITETDLLKTWNEEYKNSSYPGLSKPVIVKYTFPYSQSTMEMITDVVTKVEEEGGSTAPHILLNSVTFDENSSNYTLYFIGSHIE